jgi:hypothetical protein
MQRTPEEMIRVPAFPVPDFDNDHALVARVPLKLQAIK